MKNIKEAPAARRVPLQTARDHREYDTWCGWRIPESYPLTEISRAKQFLKMLFVTSHATKTTDKVTEQASPTDKPTASKAGPYSK